MKVHQVMSVNILTALPTTPFKELWKSIFQKKINSIPVLDSKKKVLGIVTREDLLKKLYPDFEEFVSDFAQASDFEKMERKVKELVNLKAKDLMGERIIFVRHDTFIMRALSRMIARRINQMPVLDHNDRLVGMITKGDVFYALFKRHLAGNDGSLSERTSPAKPHTRS